MEGSRARASFITVIWFGFTMFFQLVWLVEGCVCVYGAPAVCGRGCGIREASTQMSREDGGLKASVLKGPRACLGGLGPCKAERFPWRRALLVVKV